MGTGPSRRLTGFLRWLFILGPESSRNPAMEGLRALAVLLVFLVHVLGYYLQSSQHLDLTRDLGRFLPTVREVSTTNKVLMGFQRSEMGVDLFFLLSGFLICRVAGRLESLGDYRHFLWRRFLRIYPAFLASLLFCVWLYVGVLHVQQFRTRTFVGNALLLYGAPFVSVETYHFVSWSLFWEMAFYGVFPLLLILGRRAARAENVWQPLAAVAMLTVAGLGASYQCRVHMFYFGSLLALASDERLRQLAGRLSGAVVLAIYVAVDLSYRLLPRNYAWFTPLYGLAASLLVVKACYGGGRLTHLFSSLPLRWLGNLSYSFYLAHGVCIHMIWYCTGLPQLKWGRWGTLALLAGTSLALALGAAVVLFLLCERWYFFLGKRRPAVQAETVPQGEGVSRQAA